MKTAAIIAEYNPFHLGHAHQIAKLREASGCDRIIVLMSGDFVQRGEPAILDKYSRAKMALSAGADLVLELPVSAALSSADHFARGAVAILDAIGVVDELWFGSEAGEIDAFLKPASILAEEPDDYRKLLRDGLSQGLSYPAANALALVAVLKEREGAAGSRDQMAAFLARPNNILGLAYVTALKKAGSGIRPCTHKREGADYLDGELHNSFSSALSIRNALAEGEIETLRDKMPPYAFSILREAYTAGGIVLADDFSDMLFLQLMRETVDFLQQYDGISEDLANRIMKESRKYHRISSFAKGLATRNITEAHARRALMHILLGITRADVAALSRPEAVRILGLREGTDVLTLIKERGKVPLFAAAAKMPREQYERDLFASQLYEWMRAKTSGERFLHEYERALVKYSG